MTTLTAEQDNVFRRSEKWLDSKGRTGWILATVLGFIFFWPIGLALLGYMIWSNRMSRSFFSCPYSAGKFTSRKSSGNSAFDAYRDDTLRRLEEEQSDFRAFMTRLRQARDKSEFDMFLAERTKKNTDETAPV